MSQQTINSTDSPNTGRTKINSNFTELYSESGDPQYIAPLSQTSTSAPAVYGSILKNTTGSTITFERNDVGDYTLHISPVLAVTMKLEITNPLFYYGGVLYSIIVGNGQDGANVNISTFANGVAADSVLNSHYENIFTLTVFS